MESKKYNKVVNIIKRQTHRYKEQVSGYQWCEERREGQDRGRGLRGTNYYIKNKHIIQPIFHNDKYIGILPIFYSNYKWRITFKYCESLYCTPIAYVILYIKYTSIKIKCTYFKDEKSSFFKV